MPVTAQTHHIGFIGLGIMGQSMARHLMAGGYTLHVYNRTRAKAEDLLAAGAQWHDTPAGVAAAAQVVITIVGYPHDVEEVYFGPQGLLSAVQPGAVLVDMSTSEPALAIRIAQAARDKNAWALDAPVSGGDVGARNATLAIMVGGAEEPFAEVLPLFNLMGKTVARLGPAGSGQHTKMVNQIVIAGTILGVAEAVSYAGRAGLDVNAVLDVIGGGAAGGVQLNVLGRRMANGDFAPGFFVHHFIKDMKIARQEAEAMGLDLAALDTALRQFETFAAEGGRDQGTQGILNHYNKSQP